MHTTDVRSLFSSDLGARRIYFCSFSFFSFFYTRPHIIYWVWFSSVSSWSARSFPSLWWYNLLNSSSLKATLAMDWLFWKHWKATILSFGNASSNITRNMFECSRGIADDAKGNELVAFRKSLDANYENTRWRMKIYVKKSRHSQEVPSSSQDQIHKYIAYPPRIPCNFCLTHFFLSFMLFEIFEDEDSR